METIQHETLAALINSPDHAAEAFLDRVETEDFEDWRGRIIFDAARECDFPPVPVPGAVCVQINAHLLEIGRYRDSDDGLRQAVLDLATAQGFPKQLPWFADQLIEHRFRRAVGSYADSIIGHAERSPLEEIDVALRGIEELRRLRARITDDTRRSLAIVKEGGAA